MRKIRGNPLRRRRIDNPSGRQRSKSKESVKRPIRAHRCNPCFLIKAPRMVSVSICGICGRNNLVPHSTSHISHPSFRIPHSASIISHPTLHIQHSTSHISHPTFHIPHSTLHTPHSTFSTSLSACEISVPILRTGGAICVVDKHPAWFLCRSVASAGEIFLCRMAHSPFRRSHAKDIFTFSTLLPQIYTVFPVAPRPASKYAILSASLQPPNNQPFTFRRPRATFQTHLSPPRNAIFRPSIPALSRPHPLPFAPRSLSPRNPIHAQRSRHPSLTAFPPVPHFASESPKSQLPGLLFHPKSQPHISTKYLYPPPLCPIACMILWNVMGWVRNGHAHFRC